MPDTLQQRMERIEDLVRRIDEIADAGTRATVVDLMQLVMQLHAAGLERILDLADGGPESAASSNGQSHGDANGRRPLAARLASDELVSGLLMLHGLHPDDLPTRVGRALDKVRPLLRSHGGDVELLGIDDAGFVRLRLEGSCHGCPSSQMTLKSAIEEALCEFAPDMTGLEVAGVVEPRPAPAAGFVSLESLTLKESPLWNGSPDPFHE